ncbi:MAG: hypothetical protein COU06_02555 [Candidatus Harrisonbacteria bacterium CG10_big_fil_rev_8_21_14_0_10_38_8]|uniref:Uncharacterized protein n=1 Tax=Candidatus Harrisonbacteria bacterium CG10_big_fil_rev_8_21_14_0_10_38_8 TaxID=1974582 RepID=A0A2M6WJK2_9BACT|nr:MAG: hypothetical protein COU06_02555 [Candidatus Harrisonbacteria bacterium CG10_big_fil_rev_8_21_14_0_10_38_8]
MNKSQSQIQIRIDSKTKKESQDAKKGFTRSQENAFIKETKTALKNGKRYKDTDSLMDEIA